MNNEITTHFQLESLNGHVCIKNVTATPNPSGFIIEAKGSDIRENVNAILNYVYDSHDSFTEGYSVVSRGDRYGIVNLCLKEVVRAKYQDIDRIHEGFAVAKLDGMCMYIKMEGYSNPYVCEGRYDAARAIRNGVGVVKKDGMYGLFSAESLKLILPCEYEEIYEFDLCRDYTAMKKDGRWGLVNRKGEVILEPVFDSLSFDHGKNSYSAKIGDTKYVGGPDGTYTVEED